MNKAITDGVLFMPPAFEDGLDVWSSGDGTPGSDTYDGAANAAFVPADQDFGGCLEIQKSDSTQKIRYMGETPIYPGCYLQIRARVKAISGNLPDVRIAGWAGAAGGSHVTGVDETGPVTTLTDYGQVVEVTAIVGVGQRGGVDMAWGPQALYGHFGIDLTGPNGGVLRVDDIEIEDVTAVFLRDLINVVDVRDYGAMGDGTTDDAPAFEAADAAAAGRKILVPEGTYLLGDTVTLNNPVEFEGTLSMATEHMLLLTKSYDLPTYIDAFGDEELAFKKAFQALLNNADHESLDMGGRKISVSGPIDMQAVVPNKTSYATRRVIRNGQFVAENNAAWDDEVVTSKGTYATGSAKVLTNVLNVANVPVGALVQGNGVGREVYVTAKNVAAETVTLSAPLYDAVGTQTYTFTRFKYLLDFSGFSKLSKMTLSEIELQLSGRCSGILLAPTGLIFAVRDSFISGAKDRGITSHGTGCQGMLIDRCQFLSNEDSLDVPDRTSIALNTNANDIKLRDCRATKFRHFALLGGANSVVLGNHFFQGDSIAGGVRSAGLVLFQPHVSSVVSGNYIDNCFIEWSNEQDATPAFSAGYSFSALSITENVFLTGDVAPWFSYIVVKPHGSGHFITGLNVTGNKFRSLDDNIDRVERVDTSFADLNYDRFKDIDFRGNSFNAVDQQVANPLRINHVQATPAKIWTIDTDDLLPFQGWARGVTSVTAVGAIKTAGGQTLFTMPYIKAKIGTNKDQVQLVWSEDAEGEVDVHIRLDD
ncbi:glycosyl hydrolase family 28-related protein [Marinibacterium sp. SX1]|uniref:glycosyl hydrolase family 28-related protein n=1 Tax=Marinibacterium sp. SX1 TaxID=3388424 RepID=UPI003D177982